MKSYSYRTVVRLLKGEHRSRPATAAGSQHPNKFTRDLSVYAEQLSLLPTHPQENEA